MLHFADLHFHSGTAGNLGSPQFSVNPDPLLFLGEFYVAFC